MTDLVQRLRDCENYEDAWQLRQESANEIERLTAERDMLVDALKLIQFADYKPVAKVASKALAAVEKTK